MSQLCAFCLLLFYVYCSCLPMPVSSLKRAATQALQPLITVLISYPLSRHLQPKPLKNQTAALLFALAMPMVIICTAIAYPLALHRQGSALASRNCPMAKHAAMSFLEILRPITAA